MSSESDWIDKVNYFSLKFGEEIVYHGVFRYLFQYHLRSQQPTVFNQLHLKAAEWFKSRSKLDESLEHYMAANAVEQAAKLADEYASVLFAQGFKYLLLKWHAQLGAAADLAPRLKMNCARIHSENYDYVKAENSLDSVEQAFLSSSEGNLADIKLYRALIRIQEGQLRQAIVEVAPLMGLKDDLNHKRVQAYRILGSAHLRLGKMDVAQFFLEKALEMQESSTDEEAYVVANILHDLVTVYLRQGRITEARSNLYQVVELRRWINCPRGLGKALTNLGKFYHYVGNHAQASATFRESLTVLSAVSDKGVKARLLWRFGNLRRDQGRYEEAQRYYADALELVGEHEPFVSSGLQISLSVLWYWKADLTTAVSWAEKALEQATAHEIASHRTRASVAYWGAQGGKDAYDALGELAEELKQQGDQSHIIWCHVLRIEIALSIDLDLASDALECIWNLMDEGISIQTLIAEMANVPRFEEYIFKRSGGRTSKLKQGINALREEHVEGLEYPYVVGQQDRPVLRITTLGQEQIVLDGEAIAALRWKLSIPRQFFLYLLFNGPLGREQICSVFWPEGNSQQVRDNFHTLVYRTRQIVGAETIVQDESVYFVEPSINLWCDAFEFEALVEQAQSVSTSIMQAEPLWQQAVDLYQGAFLLNWDDEWILARRRKLQAAASEALIELGNCAYVRKDYKTALAVFQKLCGIDPHNEAAHRGIMRCYAETGENQQVIAQFDRLTRLLADWNVAPSNKTRALLLELTGQLSKV